MAIATANPVVSAAAGKSYFARDDYYVKNMESRDRWHGKLATKLGLNGQVTQAEFTALLDKIEERGVSTGKKVTPALDITISANKSLSLAMTYPEHGKKLQDIYLSFSQHCHLSSIYSKQDKQDHLTYL